MSESTCCLKTFQWDGTPTGHVGKLATNNAYITGTNPNVAILIVHDMLGWSFPNVRLLADHYATEANATVYVPDFFGGEVLPFEPLIAGRFAEVDLPAFRRGIRGRFENLKPSSVRGSYARSMDLPLRWDSVMAGGLFSDLLLLLALTMIVTGSP